MPHVRLSARTQSDLSRLRTFAGNDATRQHALLAIRDALTPIKHSPLIGRPVEDRSDLRELVIDFGTSGYLALYHFELGLDALTILAIKHQREDDYK